MTNQATPRDESTAAAGHVRRGWSQMSRRARVISVLWALVALALAIVLLVDQAGTTPSNATRPLPTVTNVVDRNDQQNEPPLTIAREFEPENGELSNCVGSFAERPGCGADGRGGRGQTLVFVALLGGLVFIGWRIVAGAKKQQRLRQRAGRRA